MQTNIAIVADAVLVRTFEIGDENYYRGVDTRPICCCLKLFQFTAADEFSVTKVLF